MVFFDELLRFEDGAKGTKIDRSTNEEVMRSNFRMLIVSLTQWYAVSINQIMKWNYPPWIHYTSI